MDPQSFSTPNELQQQLGERLKRLRLNRNLDQRTTAEKAGISEKALRNLEAGRGFDRGNAPARAQGARFVARHRPARS